MEIIIYQGEDKALSLLVFKDGLPLDLSTATGILMMLLINEEEQIRYSLVATQGVSPLSVDTLVTNKLLFVLESQQSRKMDTGKLTAIIQADIPDPSFVNQTRRYVTTIDIGRVMPNPAKDF